MSKKDTGGPAFPTVTSREAYTGEHFRTIHDSENGMSLRDYYAGQALAGFVMEFFRNSAAWTGYGDFAESCYHLADAMLAERSKP
jgi:hypothetical protein